MRDNSHTTTTRMLKLCGADIELGNFVLGLDRAGGTCYEASRALLRAIDGLPKPKPSSYSRASGGWQSAVYGCRRDERDSGWARGGDVQDWGRKFLPGNGGCVYIDLDHLELCIPEVTNAWDHVAAWHAMLRIARQALTTANEAQPPGRKIQVLVNNSDGQGNSYGSHLNFLVSRRLWDSIFTRKFHMLQYLASFQVSSIVFTGQGKVGSENGTPEVPFQLSQRADFFETLLGQQTTFQRPIINSRDEAHCGSWRSGGTADAARVHCIFFDNTMAHVPCLLKVGAMQIVLAMLEAGHCRPDLILDDPVDAVVRISHDPTLKTRVSLASGRQVTAVELQLLFLEEARRFAAGEGFEGVVPRAAEILDLWEDTLVKLKAGALNALAPRLDWVMKLMILERAMDSRPGLDWGASELKLLDHLYSGLDEDGLYWAYEGSGFADRVVTPEHIQRLVENPPSDTRAWTRTMLLRRAEPGTVDSVDWDTVTLRIKGKGYWPSYQTINLADPLGFTKAQMEPVFEQAGTMESVLDAIAGEAVETRPASLREWAGLDSSQRRLPAS